MSVLSLLWRKEREEEVRLRVGSSRLKIDIKIQVPGREQCAGGNSTLGWKVCSWPACASQSRAVGGCSPALGRPGMSCHWCCRRVVPSVLDGEFLTADTSHTCMNTDARRDKSKLKTLLGSILFYYIVLKQYKTFKQKQQCIGQSGYLMSRNTSTSEFS